MPLQTESPQQQRRHWMGVLARCGTDELEAACAQLAPLPRYEWLRPPETGLVMVRGRAGGSGAKFNLGEMTMTRCAVRTEAGLAGFSWVRGRDHRHAELAALLDALMQDPQRESRLLATVISPLARAQAARRESAAARAAATRVEFFTLARGEDPQ